MVLNSAVAVVDASKAKMYIKNFGEFFNNQIEHAGTIVLSRTQDISDVVKTIFDPYFDKIFVSDKQRALTCQAYFNDMYKNLICVYSGLKDGGEYHVIIGDNTIKGVDVPTHDVIRLIALEVGYECFGYYKYVIKDHRTSIPRNKENSKIEYEHVIMLRKQ